MTNHWPTETDPNDLSHSYTRILRLDGETNPLQCGSKSRMHFAKQRKQMPEGRPERNTKIWDYFLDGEPISIEELSKEVNLTIGTLQNMFYPERRKRRKEKQTIMELEHNGRTITRRKKPKRYFLRDGKIVALPTVRAVFKCLTQEAEQRIKDAGPDGVVINKKRYTLLYKDREPSN
jgi:hypothetical protein